MPKLLERLKKSIMQKQWTDKNKAYAIATSILNKNGYMKGGELTAKWVKKQALPEWTKWLKSVSKIKLKFNKK